MEMVDFSGFFEKKMTCPSSYPHLCFRKKLKNIQNGTGLVNEILDIKSGRKKRWVLNKSCGEGIIYKFAWIRGYLNIYVCIVVMF